VLTRALIRQLSLEWVDDTSCRKSAFSHILGRPSHSRWWFAIFAAAASCQLQGRGAFCMGNPTVAAIGAGVSEVPSSMVLMLIDRWQGLQALQR
jgi:hypothetical protein